MPDDDLIRRLPSERGETGRSSIVVYSCCCCCCCCLHTVGGFVGALIGGGLRPIPEIQFDPERRIPLVHWFFGRLPWSQWIFWTSFAIIVLASLLVSPALIVLGGAAPVDQALWNGPLYVAGAIILFGPLFLLGAGVLSLIRMAFTREPKVTRDHWRNVYSSIGGSILGCLLGIAVMYLLAVILSSR